MILKSKLDCNSSNGLRPYTVGQAMHCMWFCGHPFRWARSRASQSPSPCIRVKLFLWLLTCCWGIVGFGVMRACACEHKLLVCEVLYFKILVNLCFLWTVTFINKRCKLDLILGLNKWADFMVCVMPFFHFLSAQVLEKYLLGPNM